MINILHNLPFVDDRLDFLFSGKFVLAHYLHGIESARILFPNKNDATESSTPDDFDLLEIMAADLELSLCILSEGQLCKMCT